MPFTLASTQDAEVGVYVGTPEVGNHVLRENDLNDNRSKPDGVCAGRYGVDCRIVQILPLKEKSATNRTPHILCEALRHSYACLTPRELGNLLVPVCCSARMSPIAR